MPVEVFFFFFFLFERLLLLFDWIILEPYSCAVQCNSFYLERKASTSIALTILRLERITMDISLFFMCTLNAIDRAKSFIIAQRGQSLRVRASDSKVTLITLSMFCPIRISMRLVLYIQNDKHTGMHIQACRDRHTKY